MSRFDPSARRAGNTEKRLWFKRRCLALLTCAYVPTMTAFGIIADAANYYGIELSDADFRALDEEADECFRERTQNG